MNPLLNFLRLLGILKTAPSVADIMKPMASIREQLKEASEMRRGHIQKRSEVIVKLKQANTKDEDEIRLAAAQEELLNKLIAE